MKCFNKECPYYSEASDSNCRTRSTLTIDLCLTHLKAQADPVDEVPCSAGLSAELLMEKCSGLDAIKQCYEDAAHDVLTGWEEDNKKLFIKGIKGLKILTEGR